MTQRYEVPVEDPEAKLERALMEEFLRTKRHSFEDLGGLTDSERRHLLDEAATYAARRLADIGARAHFVKTLHQHE